MARNPRQAALYEVINRSRFRDAQQKALDRIGVKRQPEQPPQVLSQHEVAAEHVKVVEPVIAETVTNVAESVAAPAKPQVKPESVWSGRPKSVRFYPDRIELCFSWQVAGISLLALAAIFLVFYRLGQMSSSGSVKSPQTQAVSKVEDIKPTLPVVEKVTKPAAEVTPPKLIEPMGENVIVITNYDLSTHLEPVKQYFAQYGIATEIIKYGQRYLLVTQNRFDSIDTPGTDGYEMKKKIMSVGAKYKPPVGSGFESFGTKPFQDVYGRKIKN